MNAPNEREFAVFRRGDVREDILRFFRNGLRSLVNPKTKQSFTEDEIRRATTAGSRFYIEADAIDLVAQGIQKRDEFLAQQIRVDRAGSAMLTNYHGPMWDETYLPATGGSGSVAATGVPGTTWVGSTTIPDPFASFALDDAGNTYQVLVTESADSDGNATLLMVGVDGGKQTNIVVGTKLDWGNAPVGSTPQVTVVDDDFSGGGPQETDAEFSDRLAKRQRRKPGSGNESQMRDIARKASNSVQDAFPYPCARNAGSTLIAVLQKRAGGVGPSARLPSVGTLAAVTAALVPPASPEIPGRALVVIVSPVAQPTDSTLQVEQRDASVAGWTDLVPFPQVGTGGAAVTITTLSSQTDFRITAASAGQLPNGVAGPLAGVHLMGWNAAKSRFEVLNVNTVQDLGGGVYRVLLSSAPSYTLALGDFVSPGMLQAQSDVLAESVEAYFDSLGPGELVDLATSPLAVRAFRRPVPSEEWPQRAGTTLQQFVSDGVGAAITDSALTILSSPTPALPSDPIDGPSLLTLGKFGVYPLS